MFFIPEGLPQDGAWASLRSSEPRIIRVQAYVNEVAAESGLPLATRGFGPDRVFLSFRDLSTVQILDFIAAAVGAQWKREQESWVLVLSPGPIPSNPRPAWRELEPLLTRFSSGDALLEHAEKLRDRVKELRLERKDGWLQVLEKLDGELGELEAISDVETFDFLRAVSATKPEADGWRVLPGGRGAFESAEGLWQVDATTVRLRVGNDLAPPTEQPPFGFAPSAWDSIAALSGSIEGKTLEQWFLGLATLTDKPIIGDFGHLPLRTLARDGRSLVETGRPILWPSQQRDVFLFRLLNRNAIRASEPSDDALRLLSRRPLTMVGLASFFSSLGGKDSYAQNIRPLQPGYSLGDIDPALWTLRTVLQLPLAILDRLDKGEAISINELARPLRAKIFQEINGDVYGESTLTPGDLVTPTEKPAFLYLERVAPSKAGDQVEHTLYLGFGPRDSRTVRFTLP